jgi:hypothetical protein
MKLVDYTTEILVATVVLFFLGGVGYMIHADIDREHDVVTQCIAAGQTYCANTNT